MAVLKARDFLFRAEDRAIALLGVEAPPERRVMWTVLQYHFGQPWIHYELQPQPARGIVEVGLHFEGPAEQSERAALLVASETPAVRAALGPDWELEEWTPSWRRLHRTIAFEALTAELADETARAFAHLVTVTAPILESTGLTREALVAPPAGASRPGRPRHRR